ncbi:MAG TPA: prolyl oligopeptidase family serine peptidase, partial [Candidatus Nanopelagicales bacterium]|nr:prolyl oligopeptidase family serine peptidase [Candidatus Nanopelagicales bacterium]
MTTAAYGTWPSIITPELVTVGTVGLGSPALDGDTLYWLEARPDEGGRVGLWRQPIGGTREPLTASRFNVRSRVHEYGGGAYAVRDGVVVFSDFADGRLYRVLDGATSPLTVSGPHRYADLRVHPDLDLVLAVREDHSGAGEPVNTIVALDLLDQGAETVLCAGADFYSDPELSESGELAWTEWNHPAMPWDETRIRRGRLAGRTVVEVVEVAGGPGESAVHPRWAPGRELIFISDRTGWWNLYAVRDAVAAPLWPEDAEYAPPQWVFGDQPYVIIDSDRLLVSRITGGSTSIAVLDREAQSLRPILDAGLSGPLAAAWGLAAAVVEDPDRPARLAVADLAKGTWTDIRQASEQSLPANWVSVPREVTWQSTLPDVPGEVRGWYYPPTNPTVRPPDGERPPLITISHGGPTGLAGTGFDAALQYWTSRGFAILDVNYRGSTGYGRAYRDALNGRWGVVDVADCAAGAAALAERGMADPGRLIVRGGSAGGF